MNELVHGTSSLSSIHRVAASRKRLDVCDARVYARNDLLRNEAANALGRPLRRALPELVLALLGLALVRHLVVAQHLRPGRRNDTDVDVRTGAEIVEDTSRDGGFDQTQSFFALYFKQFTE